MDAAKRSWAVSSVLAEVELAFGFCALEVAPNAQNVIPKNIRNFVNIPYILSKNLVNQHQDTANMIATNTCEPVAKVMMYGGRGKFCRAANPHRFDRPLTDRCVNAYSAPRPTALAAVLDECRALLKTGVAPTAQGLGNPAGHSEVV